MRKKVIIGVVTALLLSACGVVDNDRESAELSRKAFSGFKLIKSGKCDEGLSLLRLGERAGQTDALLFLAHLYDQGKCVPLNPTRAFQLGKQVADQNVGVGGFLLGFFYLNGRGVAKNEAKATDIFQETVLYMGLSASDTRRDSASTYLFKRPVPGLLKRQLDWIDDVENGNAKRQYKEAIALLSQPPVTRNRLKMAWHWLHKAAKGGDANASYRLGRAYDEGLFESSYRLRAYYYFREAAERDHVEAQIKMAKLIERGLFNEPRPLRVYYWLLRAQKNGANVAADIARLKRTFTDTDIFIVNKWWTESISSP